MQVVRFDTLRDPDPGKWVFRVYAGSTTARLVSVMYARVVVSGEFSPDAEHGPLFFSVRRLFRGNNEPYSVNGGGDDLEAFEEIALLLDRDTLPLLDNLASPDEIVRLLEDNPVLSIATTERTSEILEVYKQTGLPLDLKGAQA